MSKMNNRQLVPFQERGIALLITNACVKLMVMSLVCFKSNPLLSEQSIYAIRRKVYFGNHYIKSGTDQKVDQFPPKLTRITTSVVATHLLSCLKRVLPPRASSGMTTPLLTHFSKLFWTKNCGKMASAYALIVTRFTSRCITTIGISDLLACFIRDRVTQVRHLLFCTVFGGSNINTSWHGSIIPQVEVVELL